LKDQIHDTAFPSLTLWRSTTSLPGTIEGRNLASGAVSPGQSEPILSFKAYSFFKEADCFEAGRKSRKEPNGFQVKARTFPGSQSYKGEPACFNAAIGNRG
jgi:hypothetical protein